LVAPLLEEISIGIVNMLTNRRGMAMLEEKTRLSA
jgi:hypothetical protein